MNKRLKILLLSVCATVVSVAIWIVAVVLNLVKVLFGEAGAAMWVGWLIAIASTVVFFVVFYRHFKRTEK